MILHTWKGSVTWIASLNYSAAWNCIVYTFLGTNCFFMFNRVFRFTTVQLLSRLIKLILWRITLQLYFSKVWYPYAYFSFLYDVLWFHAWGFNNKNKKETCVFMHTFSFCRWWWWNGPWTYSEMHELGLFFKEVKYNNWTM